LIIRKPSWCGQEQFLRHAPLDADHFSHAECWMALKFSGIPQLYSFRAGKSMCAAGSSPGDFSWRRQSKVLPRFYAGKLQDAEVEVPCPDFLPSGVESMQEMEVELVAIWLDLASAYRPGERMHREDLTIALQRISVGSAPVEERVVTDHLLPLILPPLSVIPSVTSGMPLSRPRPARQPPRFGCCETDL
jgi:hypothetical protein